MSQTVAEAAAAYRKRRGDKIARYEAALRAVLDTQVTPINVADSAARNGGALIRAHALARNALNPETNDG